MPAEDAAANPKKKKKKSSKNKVKKTDVGEGWTHCEQLDGKVYFWHKADNLTQWEPPDHLEEDHGQLLDQLDLLADDGGGGGGLGAGQAGLAAEGGGGRAFGQDLPESPLAASEPEDVWTPQARRPVAGSRPKSPVMPDRPVTPSTAGAAAGAAGALLGTEPGGSSGGGGGGGFGGGGGGGGAGATEDELLQEILELEEALAAAGAPPFALPVLPPSPPFWPAALPLRAGHRCLPHSSYDCSCDNCPCGRRRRP